MFDINIELIDDIESPRVFEITQDGEQVLVRAHVELSEGEVRAACSQLGHLDEPVFDAWRSRIGIT